jgi:arginase family enzyme
MSPQIKIYQLPTEAGTHFPGQRLAPARIVESKIAGSNDSRPGLRQRLEEAGFEVDIGSELLKALPREVTAWKASADFEGARNHDNAINVCKTIADGLGSLDEAAWPQRHGFSIFLGGDCSITPAILTGLYRLCAKGATDSPAPSIGIIYMDGDVDLTLPSNSTGDGSSHILDSMVLTHLTRRPGGLESMKQITRTNGQPLVSSDNIVLFGFDPLQPSPEHFTFLLENQFKCYARPSVRANPVETAEATLEWLKQRVDVIVLHFDVDVIDSAEFPLANYPHYAGLHHTEAWEAIQVFLKDDAVKALIVTEVNPNNDPDGWMTGQLVEAISQGLAGRLS